MVDYRISQNKPMGNDEFNTTLKETYDFFKQKYQVNIIGEGIKDVFTDNGNFSNYVDKLVEGLEATEESQVRTLLESSKMNLLTESSLAGIAPISSLSMPTIRKMWAKIALKYAVPTEPVTLPSFAISFNKPYIEENGTKHYLPEALKISGNGLAEKVKLETKDLTVPMDNYDLLGPVSSSKATGDSVDSQFSIIELAVKCLDKSGANEETVVVKVNSKLDINRRLYLEVNAKHSDGTVTKDVVMGSVDLSQGTMTLMSLKSAVKTVKIQGYVSSEAHNKATNISFEIERRDISIGTGTHIEASLPIEFLNDTMALYNIDGAAEVIDLMSNVNAQKIDQEIYLFLNKAYEGTGGTYQGEFDMMPSASFAGNPKDWIEEIKRVIDFFATKMKTESYYYSGRFMIVGNPLDTMLLPNVTWTFNHVSDNQNGVEVEYSIGAMSGANSYQIISSDLIPQGELTMFFVPNTDRYKTFVYYPYTFNIVHNYLNTVKQNVPSVMMTKRQTLEEFLPIIGKIKIKNNNGSLPK